MDRKSFLKKSLFGAAGLGLGTKALNAKTENKETSTYDKLMEQVGFNHLPNEETMTAKTVLHKANTRGHANHGWLDSHHSFSFANYYNPDRMHFGVLRVLNDDVVAGGRGFRRHPHDNMEIISIPLSGDLEHKDSMGNTAIIKQGDVQIMSAGTGIYHSEFNKNKNQEVRFLQIWMFPNRKNVQARYDQITIEKIANDSVFRQILSPSSKDAGVWAYQHAWFHLGDLEKACSETYQIRRPGNGVYAFIIEGDVTIEGQKLNKRDGFGIWDTSQLSITADTNAKVLLMDVPMRL